MEHQFFVEFVVLSKFPEKLKYFKIFLKSRNTFVYLLAISPVYWKISPICQFYERLQIQVSHTRYGFM